MFASSGIVALGTATSRLTGFVALAAIAYAFGFTRLTDTYNLANTTPNMLFELLLGGILSATLVPVFVAAVESDDDDAINAVVTVAGVAMIALTVIGIALAPMVVGLYSVRVHGATAVEQKELAGALLRLFMPQVFFYGAIALATALLHARRMFIAAAFAPALANLAEIALFLGMRHAAHGQPTLSQVAGNTGLTVLLGLGATIAVASMALPILVSLHRHRLVPRWRFDWRHPAVRRVGALSGWTVGYAAMNQLALWVTLILANGHPGGVAAYLAAFVFFQLPHGLFAVSMMTTVTPELARLAGRQERDRFNARFAGGLRLIWLIVIPAAVGYLLLARPLVGALLEHGALTAASAHQTAGILAAFAVGLPAFSTYLYALRGFYALGDTRTPFLLNVAENIANIALALIFERFFGLPGLALGYAAAYMIGAVLALTALRRRQGRLITRPTVIALAKTVGAAAGMAAAVGAATHITGPMVAGREVAVGVATGAATFGALILGLRSPDALAIVRGAQATMRNRR